MSIPELDSLREQIDQCDREILEAFNRRTRLASRMARLKLANQLPLVDAEREKQIIARAGAFGSRAVLVQTEVLNQCVAIMRCETERGDQCQQNQPLNKVNGHLTNE